MHHTSNDIRRYVVSGQEHEYGKMVDFVKEHNAKIVRENRIECTHIDGRVLAGQGVTIYAERNLRKLRKARTTQIIANAKKGYKNLRK